MEGPRIKVCGPLFYLVIMKKISFWILALCLVALPALAADQAELNGLLDLPHGVFFGMSQADIVTGPDAKVVSEGGFVRDSNVVKIGGMYVGRSYFFENDQLTTFTYHIAPPGVNRAAFMQAYTQLQNMFCAENGGGREAFLSGDDHITETEAKALFLDTVYFGNMRLIELWEESRQCYVSLGLNDRKPFLMISFRPLADE